MEGESRDLRDVTRDWFIFLSTCRRQVDALPAHPEWMRDKLDTLMAEMAAAVKHDPRLEAAYLHAKYPLVYLADEILLSCGWQGEAAWASDLYETRQFNTQHAGLDFFTRLEQAMQGDRDDLIEIYYKCLCLGFRGKLIKQPDALHNIRRDLFRRLPRARRQDGQRFCPQAYEQTDERSFTKLPVVSAARILIPLVALLIGVWLVGMARTNSQLSDIRIKAKEYITEGED